MLEHLGGMQAQEPQAPFVGLWSRIRDFDPHELDGLLERREAVRLLLMRGTVHLVTARDCLAFRAMVAESLRKRVTRRRCARGSTAWGSTRSPGSRRR